MTLKVNCVNLGGLVDKKMKDLWKVDIWLNLTCDFKGQFL